MLGYLQKARQYLWAFVEIGFLTILAIMLIYLILGPDSGVFVSGVANNVVKFAGAIPSQSVIGIAIVLALIVMIAKRKLKSLNGRIGAGASAAELNRRALFEGDTLFLQQRLQLARLEHLADNIAPADELTLDVSCGMVGQLEKALTPPRSSSFSSTLRPLSGDAEVIQNLRRLFRKNHTSEIAACLS